MPTAAILRTLLVPSTPFTPNVDVKGHAVLLDRTLHSAALADSAVASARLSDSGVHHVVLGDS